MHLAREATALGEMKQNKGHYVVEGHLRSLLSVSIESTSCPVSQHFGYIADYLLIFCC